MFKDLKFPSRGARIASLAMAAGWAAFGLAGCQLDQATGAPPVTDYHDHYPIALTQSSTTTDLFVEGARLDDRTRAQIRAFAERYRAFGSNQIVILTPSIGGHGNVSSEIRHELYAAGLRGNVSVGSYPVSDAGSAAPIRLVYQGLSAKVRAKCGEWREDIGPGSLVHDWSNEEYPNFGCATQTMLANQIDDPRDLAGAQPVTEPDVEMRLRAIGDVRKGADPATAWSIHNTTIGSVGGN